MASVVKVLIHSEISEFPTEKRYDPNIQVSELKKKLELITGANHKTMKVTLHISEENLVELSDDEKTLSNYLGDNVTNETSFKLVVQDDQAKDLLSGDVPKYTISEEKYESRPNTARNFIKEVREKRMSGDTKDACI